MQKAENSKISNLDVNRDVDDEDISESEDEPVC